MEENITMNDMILTSPAAFHPEDGQTSQSVVNQA